MLLAYLLFEENDFIKLLQIYSSEDLMHSAAHLLSEKFIISTTAFILVWIAIKIKQQDRKQL